MSVLRRMASTIPSYMKAISVKGGKGDASALFVDDQVPVPKLAPGTALVRVSATALNRADILQRKGLYPPPPGTSNIIGLEIAGEVVDIAEEDQTNTAIRNFSIKKGLKVMALLGGGGYAQYCLVPTQQLMPIPNGLSYEEAAAIPEAWLTAWQHVKWIGGVMGDPHDPERVVKSVLLHAGASGVATAALQICKQVPGCDVYVTASSKEKIDFCKKLGANDGVNYKENPKWEDEMLKFTNNKGIDIIVCPIGATYLNQNIKCMATDARMTLLATMGGGKIGGDTGLEMDLRLVLSKRLRIQGSTLRTRSLEYKERLCADFISFAKPLFEKKQFKPVIDRVFEFDQIVEAHEYMEENKNMGKIILKVP